MLLAVPKAAWLSLMLLAAADPQVSQFDELATRRDRPAEAAALQALADSFAGSQDYERLWRSARWYAWLAGGEVTSDEKRDLAKKGWEIGQRAEKLNPKGIEARYWTAINVGFYASAIPVLEALTLGIEKKFRDPLQEVAKANADHRSFAVERIGPEMALGSFFYRMPWPKQDKGKSRDWFGRALQAQPENLRAHYLHAETLVDDKPAARKELEVVLSGSEDYDPPDARRFKRYAQKLLATLQ